MAYVRIRSTLEVYHVRPKEEAIGSQAYQDAGVNIDAGAALVDAIRPLAQATMRRGVVTGLGGFGAVFDPAAAGHGGSLLVAATDGVGTKLKVAVAAGRHDTVGIDLVAMCVNDIVVVCAEPWLSGRHHARQTHHLHLSPGLPGKDYSMSSQAHGQHQERRRKT